MTDAYAGQSILLRAAHASSARTLLDVLRATTARHPEASAIEDANGSLSYRELMARATERRRGDDEPERAHSSPRTLHRSAGE